MTNIQTTQRIHYLSLINVVSAFAVVALHCNGCFWTFSTDSYWFSANLIESLLYFACPMFFMSTGITLMDYTDRYTTKDYLLKRVTKTLIPFIAWSLIAILYLALLHRYDLSFSLSSLKNVVLSVINVEPISIFWFFKSIFEIYLCMPLFAAVKKSSRKQTFSYLAAVCFIFNALIPFLCNLFQINYYNRIFVWSAANNLIWILLGWLLNSMTFTKVQRIMIYVLGIFGFLLHSVGTYVSSMQAGYIITTFKGYENVPSILYSCAIFVFLKEIGSKIKNEKFISVIEKLSSYTFAIYLIHWFILDFINSYIISDTTSLLYRLVSPFITCLICTCIAYLIRKIPILKKIMP